MNRRKLLKKSIYLGLAGAVAGSGVWLMNGNDVSQLTIEQAIIDLQTLYLLPIETEDGWNISQIYNHLAQSIEYSMTGYPEHKSTEFKNTLGQAAFSVFSYRGKMSHDLLEPIPGAPVLRADNKLLAFSRLLNALNDFKTFKGQLEPHFAYGELNHQQYTLAHVMHINNHLEQWLS
ncbi:DUF1569 domain-containing protein [Marinicella litoralis]|uniref:Uncharacterized protein DUF1569 n=1 Tax=Marinicella litoralis TaxID=644220 RepID=A0A4R6XZ34_9GAMM|nr:DUF1569 domain-containing protein [Marinicella litoralis]TDR23537.1 uncharacterized protein DUF1569 [Marinicella litoralis]